LLGKDVHRVGPEVPVDVEIGKKPPERAVQPGERAAMPAPPRLFYVARCGQIDIELDYPPTPFGQAAGIERIAQGETQGLSEGARLRGRHAARAPHRPGGLWLWGPWSPGRTLASGKTPLRPRVSGAHLYTRRKCRIVASFTSETPWRLSLAKPTPGDRRLGNRTQLSRREGVFPMDFTVPALPYAKDALEPVMCAETLEFHYEKHHKGYMTKLKAALEG